MDLYGILLFRCKFFFYLPILIQKEQSPFQLERVIFELFVFLTELNRVVPVVFLKNLNKTEKILRSNLASAFFVLHQCNKLKHWKMHKTKVRMHHLQHWQYHQYRQWCHQQPGHHEDNCAALRL